jgi:hypothetical protein
MASLGVYDRGLPQPSAVRLASPWPLYVDLEAAPPSFKSLEA